MWIAWQSRRAAAFVRPSLPRRATSMAAERRRRETGILKHLPQVPKAEELVSRAERRSRKIRRDPKEKNVKKQAVKCAAQQADELGQAVSVPLRTLIKTFDTSYLRRCLPAFDAVAAELTLEARLRMGGRPLHDVVIELNELRKGVMQEAKDGAAKAKAARSADEASAAFEECAEAVAARLKSGGHSLDELRRISRALKGIPTVSLSIPIAVLVGAPNVGKSTLVRQLSTGEPTVGNYAFTTKGVTLGHVKQGARDILGQVMDTPGVLDRPQDDRNAMEALTIAAMRHLPSAVIFVLDLTGHAGDRTSSAAAQLRLRDELRARFPQRPWIDVVAKADLELEIEPPPGAIQVSVRDERGLEDLRLRLNDLFLEIQPLTKAHHSALTEPSLV